jgi:hypothetical protein
MTGTSITPSTPASTEINYATHHGFLDLDVTPSTCRSCNKAREPPRGGTFRPIPPGAGACSSTRRLPRLVTTGGRCLGRADPHTGCGPCQRAA